MNAGVPANRRILIITPIVVMPDVVAYKLLGDVGDLAYGRRAGEILPGLLFCGLEAGAAVIGVV